MKLKLLWVVLGSLLTSACVTNNNLYQWGNYEEALFVYYHEPEVKEEILIDYLEFIETAQQKPKPVAPGLFAEAGTFLLEQGKRAEAIKFYQLEHDTWPESQLFMAALIRNLQTQQGQ
ncbi:MULTISPECIES: DUF4810 domain-containing protein [Idiomarina]|uniref:DUF4810 domain-containing protein n=1 Tax=Idiomarina TaxID=135575 RepID=UPI00129D05B4|nr:MULTISPECIES: DUF4810 domain-containing protein [Idiomarina]MRJ42194.1 DUF4810 domain-containing protein [Idiomarina sp. FeN1]NCU57120.1 DUF4810 domain-containing protein [Idiomarina sp. FenA--70]NCU59829.1 DUF4810 domain-containing protein [Idiomarina sp. FenBw--71]UUN13180.1 DUF4810 domain-containing protein [Idiomarina loihiensis]